MTEVPDRVAVANFIARHIKSTARGKVDQEQLANAISEIELESQIEGASFIRVHVIDPYWKLATLGFLDVSEEGLLDKIECEFPEKSGWWWRLAAVELSNDIEANLVLVFEDRIVAWLREMRGEKTCPPGLTTRAQFVRALLVEPSAKDPTKKINAVIPSLNVIQPVESKKVTAQEIVSEELTDAAHATAHAKINKTGGVGAGAAVTVGGKPISAAQRAQANILLGVANAKGANRVATEALIFAAIAESRLTAITQANPDGYWGTLQGNKQTWPNASDTDGMAESFLEGGKGFQAGGAKHLSRTSHNPIEIAVKVEAPSVWPENAYAKEEGYEHFLAEAQAIIDAGGGVTGGSEGSSEESDIKQLQRGSTQNPDEDSFECIERLAKQDRWFAFSNGNYFYYLNGFDFERQKPSAYIDLPARTVKNGHTGKTETDVVQAGLLANFDNTTFQYYATHKKHGRAIRKSKIAKPQTPSEIRLPMLCSPTEYRAGDVFVFQNSGPLNGRWVITDAVRNYLMDQFTTFTLEPPEAPYPEPRAIATTTSTPTAASSTPESTPSGTSVPATSWNPNGKPIANWIVPILSWAASHGWSGTVTSGYRTSQEQLLAATKYAAEKGTSVAAIYPNGPLASNHCKTAYPGGAVDVTNAEQLNTVLKGYGQTPTLIWGQTTIEDGVHFSATGH